MSVSLPNSTVSSLSSNNNNLNDVSANQWKRVLVFRPSGKLSKSRIDRIEAWQGSNGTWELLGIIYKSNEPTLQNGYHSVICGAKVLKGDSGEIISDVKLTKKAKAIIASDVNPVMYLVLNA